MLSITELKTGTTIEWKGEPYVVIAYEHGKLGRGGGFVRTRLRNLLSGNVIEETFKGAVQVEEANLEKRSASFLYRQNNQLVFMDSANFEQYQIPAKSLGVSAGFLKEGQAVLALIFKGNPISAELPIKVELKVTETPPGVRGDTATGGQKQALLESGATISVPLFINEGEIIRVNTQEGTYVERAK